MSRLTPLIILLLLAASATAQIEVSPSTPTEGQPVDLRFAQPVDTLKVTYRPGSATETADTLLLGGRTTATWTPSRPGVVSLTPDGRAPENVSVQFRETSGLGLFVMIVAGMILFGGIGFAFRAMMGDDEFTQEPFLGDT